MYKNDGINRRYSEGYKLKVLAKLSTGKYNKTEIGRIYGINRTTLNKWIEKYDHKDLMNTRITVGTTDYDSLSLKTLDIIPPVEQMKNFKEVLTKLGFEDSGDSFTKEFKEIDAFLKVDFKNQQLIYLEEKGLVDARQTCNFSDNENFVVFECVHAL